MYKRRAKINQTKGNKKKLDYNEILKIRNKLYNDWVESYENLTIKNKNDINTRNKNIKSLLLSFYSLFPPLRNEGLNLKEIVTNKQKRDRQSRTSKKRRL